MKKTILLYFLLMANIIIAIPSYNQINNQDKNKKTNMEIVYENAQIMDHPVLGILILSKDRWKNWIVRNFIIISIFIALTILNLSLPKDNEINIIFSYFLGGAIFIVSIWETLAGWMLTRLNKNLYGLIFILISIPMYIFTYIMLMKTKKADISFDTLKKSFQKLLQTSNEDKRLLPLPGTPGDWVEDDIIH